jgi:5-oxoprolinase (ATP-hydrolysing)
MTRVFIHPLAGVLSAYGMGLADVRALRQRAVETPLSPAALADVEAAFDELSGMARDDVAVQGIAAAAIAIKRTLYERWPGVGSR